jgi:nitroreductase
MISELIQKCRSYRRFYEEVTITTEDLKEMVNNARLSASARNGQTLKYYISNTSKLNAEIFPCLAWAGYLKEWPGPEEGERPSAYIIMLNDDSLGNNYPCDNGIAAQSILLTAVEKGLGGCIIGAVTRDKLKQILNLPENLQIIQVIALGKPKETVVIETLENNGDIKYWRDENNIHHVPKRKLEDVIVKC